ncbi:hypothetical protein EDC01DRAFT_782609 [Geopyxis carbonaria]|nr:hypothetical protein EDC01DRAFT_782609 [Geopyxis carbonaria]
MASFVLPGPYMEQDIQDALDEFIWKYHRIVATMTAGDLTKKVSFTPPSTAGWTFYKYMDEVDKYLKLVKSMLDKTDELDANQVKKWRSREIAAKRLLELMKVYNRHPKSLGFPRFEDTEEFWEWRGIIDDLWNTVDQMP